MAVMVIILKAAVAGLITATVASAVTLVVAMRSSSRAVRSMQLEPEMEGQGFWVIEPGFFVMVTVAFLAGFCTALWWLLRSRGLVTT